MRSPIDPATPEAYPWVFWLGKCAACTRCFIDRRTGRCICGGPFDADLQVTQAYIDLNHNGEPR